MKGNWLSVFTALLVLVLAVMLMTPSTTAYAQSEQPPAPPQDGETENPPAESGETTAEPETSQADTGEAEPAADEAPANTSEAPANAGEAPANTGEAPATDGIPAGNTPPLSETVSTLAEEGLALVDGAGQPIPLASEAALDALTAPDPYFAVSDHGASCTGSYSGGFCRFTTITDAINAFTASNGNGNITVEGGNYTENVTINSIANLTGLIGSSGAAVFINGDVTIHQNDGFNLENLSIFGNVSITSDNDVYVSEVEVLSGASERHGLSIDSGGGNAIVTYTSVDNGNGASVEGQNIYVSNSSFSGNTGFGLDAATLPGGMLGVDNSQFNHNALDGLYGAASNFSLGMIEANHNGQNGVYLFHRDSGGIMIDQANIEAAQFNHNGEWGLVIEGDPLPVPPYVGSSQAICNGSGPYLGPALNPASNIAGGCSSEAQKEKEAGPHSTLYNNFLTPGPQIIHVFRDGGSGPFDLDRSRELIYKLWQKQPLEAPDNALLGQVNLPAYTIPQGGSASFSPLEAGSLPAALANGATLIGPAYTFGMTDENGANLEKLNGSATVSFFLPVGYLLPEGQQFAILFYDAAAGQWVQVPITVAGNQIYAQVDKPGTYLLAAVAR